MLKGIFVKGKYISTDKAAPSVPAGMWVKCPKCGKLLYKEDVVANYYSCTKCNGYFRVKASNRLKMIVDKGTFEEWFADIEGDNPLDFPGYEQKLTEVREKTGLTEAVRIGRGKVEGHDAVIGVCDARFLMGSMGYAVGEKISLAFEKAADEQLPVIMFCCSGGARMQEGIVSLMQMAKTSAAVKKHAEAGLLYLSVLTDPTTGGVTASFAMLGDIILAEPGALIGFAGPRVIRQTIGEDLPEGFQRAEFLQEHGMIDGVVERRLLREQIAHLLQLHKQKEQKLHCEEPNIESTQSTGKQSRTPWERIIAARDAKRPSAEDYIEYIINDFTELHGDRLYRDDGAIVGGIGTLNGHSVTVIGIQKGKDTKENIHCNFGMPSPEGYRKALRLMKQAEKFGRPIITLIDTPGAFPGIGAEERGQGEAIARNLMEMSALTVPVLSIVIGEGGSGGALALGVGNEVWMMENAVYSILSPEGFASILWKDSSRAREAADIMKVTAADLYQLGIIEYIIPEPEQITIDSLVQVSEGLKARVYQFIQKYQKYKKADLVEQRYERFRKM